MAKKTNPKSPEANDAGNNATAHSGPKKRKFNGVIKLDVRDSKPDWTPYETPRAPAGAPNILVVLYDDTGLAAWSPFGGKINMPTLQKLADTGLRLVGNTPAEFATFLAQEIEKFSAIVKAANIKAE